MSVVLAVGILVSAGVLVHLGGPARSNGHRVAAASGTPASTVAPPAGSAPVTPRPIAATSGVATASSSSGTPATVPRAPSVHTPQGLWWGVDSTEPISSATIGNVRGWYRGGSRPQFWGRYLRGSYGVSRAELAYARTQKIFVYLIVGDLNCSGCGGGDVCANDRTAAQARADAQDAIRQARRLRLPPRTALFKDLEQVSGCRGEPTAAYLLGWYHTVGAAGFRTAFYGNVHKQFYDFPVAYCRALSIDPTLGTQVILDMNEDEPLIGAARGATGPGNAPSFAPNSPWCAPRAATKIWQYGESLTSANLTDIDQARPDTPGLLAPDGSATS